MDLQEDKTQAYLELHDRESNWTVYIGVLFLLTSENSNLQYQLSQTFVDLERRCNSCNHPSKLQLLVWNFCKIHLWVAVSTNINDFLTLSESRHLFGRPRTACYLCRCDRLSSKVHRTFLHDRARFWNSTRIAHRPEVSLNKHHRVLVVTHLNLPKYLRKGILCHLMVQKYFQWF